MSGIFYIFPFFILLFALLIAHQALEGVVRRYVKYIFVCIYILRMIRIFGTEQYMEYEITKRLTESDFMVADSANMLFFPLDTIANIRKIRFGDGDKVYSIDNSDDLPIIIGTFSVEVYFNHREVNIFVHTPRGDTYYPEFKGDTLSFASYCHEGFRNCLYFLRQSN